jgi:hypothetical protein
VQFLSTTGLLVFVWVGAHERISIQMLRLALGRYLVGGGQQRFRDGEAERFGGLDDELELGRLQAVPASSSSRLFGGTKIVPSGYWH